jgi:hypothetical protein
MVLDQDRRHDESANDDEVIRMGIPILHFDRRRPARFSGIRLGQPGPFLYARLTRRTAGNFIARHTNVEGLHLFVIGRRWAVTAIFEWKREGQS